MMMMVVVVVMMMMMILPFVIGKLLIESKVLRNQNTRRREWGYSHSFLVNGKTLRGEAIRRCGNNSFIFSLRELYICGFLNSVYVRSRHFACFRQADAFSSTVSSAWWCHARRSAGCLAVLNARLLL